LIPASPDRIDIFEAMPRCDKCEKPATVHITAPHVAEHHYCDEHAPADVGSKRPSSADLTQRLRDSQARHEELPARLKQQRQEDVHARDLLLAELRKLTELLTRLVEKLDR
jgi:hypothetical protein